MMRLELLLSFALLIGAQSTGMAIVEDHTMGQDLMIWAFCPATPDGGEYVMLKSPSGGAVEGSWMLGDGEGTFVFSAKVAAGGAVVLHRGNITKWEMLAADDLVLDVASLDSGRFRLSDTGDKIELLSAGGTLLDAVVYGDGEGSAGWSGDAVPFLGTGFAPGRNGLVDSNSIDDWNYLRRVNSTQMVQSNAREVKAFVIPDAGYSNLVGFVGDAMDTIDLNSYTISGDPVYRSLEGAVARGVRVRVIADDAPVTGIDNHSLNLLTSLSDIGVMVKLSSPFYRYDHAKYIVADGSRALITTDNLGPSSFDPGATCCNRGMGVIVDDPGIASRLEATYESDWDQAIPYEPVARGSLQGAVHGAYRPRFDHAVTSSDVNVSLFVTPEMGVSPLVSVLGSANRSIVAWLSDSEPNATVKGRSWRNPLFETLADASMRNVSVRVIASDRDVDMLRQWFKDRASKVEVRGLGNGLLVHAKTAIVDGRLSIMSSMNWVFNSMYKNREIGVVVNDTVISAFYEKVFETDWAGDNGEPIARISMNGLTSVGEIIHLSGLGSVDDIRVENYSWNADGINISTLPELDHAFVTPGAHSISLTVRDQAGNSNKTVKKIFVTISSEEFRSFDGTSSPQGFYGALVGLGCLASWLSGRKTRKRRTEKGKRRVLWPRTEDRRHRRPTCRAGSSTVWPTPSAASSWPSRTSSVRMATSGSSPPHRPSPAVAPTGLDRNPPRG